MVEWSELTDEQRRAAETLDRNVSVTAGAGTGKTTALTARVMHILRESVETDDSDLSGDTSSSGFMSDWTPPVTAENLLVTTFTERAANELRASVRDELLEEMDGTEGEAYRRWRAVADGLDSGYIHTLHAFCARLLREHALESEQVEPGFETLDEEETAALIRRLTARALEERSDADSLRQLGRRYSRGTVTAMVVGLLEARPGGLEWAAAMQDISEEAYIDCIWDELHPISPAFARRTFAGQTGDILERFVELVSDPPAVSTSDSMWKRVVDIVATLDAAGLPAETPPDDRVYQRCVNALCDSLTRSGGGLYAEASYIGVDSNWTGIEGIQQEIADGMAALLEWLDPASRHIAADIEADRNAFPYVRALAELTHDVGQRYAAEKRSRNIVDYADQIGFARSFLLEEASPETREALRNRFESVMIDEFQDTDPRQWDIVRALTSTDPTSFDARNVFVVGDTKQSIYRFRNADVTMFGEVAEELERMNTTLDDAADRTVTEDHLSRNFRTLEPVLEVINRLFEHTFAAGPDATYEAEPQSLRAYRSNPEDIEPTTEYLAVPTDETLLGQLYDDPPLDPSTATSSIELEAEALANRLTEVLASDRQVYETETEREGSEVGILDHTMGSDRGPEDGDEPIARDIEPRDIAILLRSRTYLKTYERALSEAGIPYTVASGLGFYETPEIEALLNLLRVLVDPEDERALYGVLRSPLFGLTDETIVTLRLEAPKAGLWVALGRTETPELAEVRDRLERWRELAGLEDRPRTVESWSELLTTIIDETGYLVSISASDRPQQAVANVDKFREQLRGWGETAPTSLTALLDRIEVQVEYSNREGEADIPTDTEGVQIMTIHGAKGDEFPMVVVPWVDRGFLDRAALANQKAEFESLPGGPALGLRGPDPNDPMNDASTIARVGIRRHRRREERAEEKRMLYVACTRARDHLLLSGTHDVARDADPATDGLHAIEGTDSDEAGSWRDWVQSALLDEDLLDELGTERVATGSLGDWGYTVRLPAAAVDWEHGGDVTEPTVSIDRPAITDPEWRYRFSPSSLHALFAGEGRLVEDSVSGVVSLQMDDDGTDEDTDREYLRGIPAGTFGEIVHTLAELRPPEERWERLAREQVAADDEADPELLDMSTVEAHGRAVTSFLEETIDTTSPTDIHHELYVTAEFDGGETGGFIDLLLVTDDRFHIIDYKTSLVTEETVAEKAEEYKPQLEAYAVALGQQATSRDVDLTLFFTGIGEAVSWGYTTDELDDLEESLERRIIGQFDS